MIRLRLLLLTPLIATGLLLGGCFELEGFVLDDFAGSTGEIPDLSTNPDPEIQAAAAASREIEEDKQAQRSMQRAIDNNQLDAALEAVELRPLDPKLRVEFAALLLANDDLANAREEFEFAGGLLAFDRVGEKGRYQYAADGLLRVRQSLEPGSASWQRVNKEYCAAIKLYRDAIAGPGNVLDSIFTLASYPAQDCP